MLRQARLKPAFAALYPSLSPDCWLTAAALAGRVKGSRIILEGPGAKFPERILQSAHFEFRGGSARYGSWLGLRTRRIDRQAGGGRASSGAALGWLSTA